MTIYILDNNPELCSQYLDDRSLDKQIREITVALINAHCKYTQKPIYTVRADTPIPARRPNHKWSQWARECKANYLYLVELADACGKEIYYRQRGKQKIHDKYYPILEWARDNVPDLPEKRVIGYPVGFGYPTGTREIPRQEVPLFMPKKYRLGKWYLQNPTRNPLNTEYCKIESYRNYYTAKLNHQKVNAVKQAVKNIMTVKDNTAFFPQWTNRNKPKWLNS